MTVRMKTWWLGLLCWSLVGRSLAQQPVPAITLIGQGSAEDIIFGYYQNEFQDQVRLIIRPDSVTGRWLPYRLPTTSPLWLQFATTSDQYSIFVRPGDTISIQAQAAHSPYYIFRHPHASAARQAELNFFSSLQPRGLAMELPDFMGLFVNARYPRQAEEFCRKFDQRRAWLQHQQDSLPLSPPFVAYIGQELRAQYLSALFFPYWGEERAFTQIPRTYDHTLDASGAAHFFTADSLVRSSLKYRSAAVDYVHYLSRDSMGTPAELAAQYGHARQALRGSTRDYVLFFLLKQNLGKQLPTYARYLDRFRQECTTPAYVRYLDSLAARPSGLRARPDLAATPLRSSTGEALTWAQLLGRNQGRVIYVDLWASWCAPCLAEMPASATLQRTLRGQPIQFLYVSLDTDPAKWHRALTTHHLTQPGTQHYLLDPESALAKYFNAPPIPRYILLDKQGQVVSLDAARPSSTLLGTDLRKLLP
jgi:thiol-disulfide isomerase/thioredoxin